jgi:hypothetical protein
VSTYLPKHLDNGETPAGKFSKAVALQGHRQKDATTCGCELEASRDTELNI